MFVPVGRAARGTLTAVSLALLTGACDHEPTAPASDLIAFDESAEETPTCSVGLWKNDLALWSSTGYAPEDPVSNAFGGAGPYAGNSLADALAFAGGPRADGAMRILLRAGVAALLNASHPANDYDLSAAAIIAMVEDALASGKRRAMLAAASDLEARNELTCALIAGPPPTPLPDLVVSGITFGQFPEWTATIRNQGTTPVNVEGVVVQGYFSADEVVDAGDGPACGRVLLAITLDPGGALSVPTGCGAPVPIGANYLLIVVDLDGLIAESDETNNVGSIGIN